MCDIEMVGDAMDQLADLQELSRMDEWESREEFEAENQSRRQAQKDLEELDNEWDEAKYWEQLEWELDQEAVAEQILAEEMPF